MVRSIIATLLLLVYQYTVLLSQCGTTVTVPADITLCNPDDVVLDGQINGPYLNFLWTGTNGFSTSTNLSPTVYVDQTTTFVLQSRSIPGPLDNIIINGDFENGNTGFTSEYLYVSTPGPSALWNEGTYTVGNNPKNYHANFKPCTDHTGGGDMMIVNGAASLSKVWCQTVTIMPNTVYVFQAWAASVENSSPAKLQFSMNGVLIGSIFNVPGSTCVWSNFYELWDSGSATSVEICITNQNFASSGNDFAIDDIYFAPTCVSEESVKVTVIDYEPMITGQELLTCDKQEVTLIGSTTPAGNYTYTWSTASGNYTNGSSPEEIIVDESGYYNLIVIDDNNCTRIIETFIEEDVAIPEAALEVSGVIDCTHPSALIKIDLVASGHAFQWIGPSNFQSSDKDIEVFIPGIYTVVITNTANGCIFETNAEVVGAFDGPQFELTKDHDLTCTYNNATISSNLTDPVYQYLWSGPQVSATQANQPSMTTDVVGQYSLQVTDANGCSTIQHMTIDSIPPLIQLQVVPQDTLTCTQSIIQLRTNYIGPVDSVKWTGPQNFSSSQWHPMTTLKGKYYLTALDTNHCVVIDSLEILDDKIVTLPTYATEAINCADNNGTISVNATAGLMAVINLTTGDSIPFNTPQELYVEGSYTIEVTAINGCKDSFDIFLNKTIDFPVNDITSGVITCTNPSVNVQVITNIPSSYQWINDNIVIDTSKNILAQKAGNYYLITTSSLGCISYDTIVITTDTIKPDIQLHFDRLTCRQVSVTPIIDQWNNNAYSFTWQGQGTFIDSSLQTIIKNSGQYTLTTKANNGCESVTTYSVEEEKGIPEVTIHGPEVLNCMQTSVTKTFTAKSPIIEATWKSGNQSLQSNDYTIAKAGQYSFICADAISGCRDTVYFSVLENKIRPVCAIIGDDTITCKRPIIERKMSCDSADLMASWKYGGQRIIGSKIGNISSSGTLTLYVQHKTSFCEDSVTVMIHKDIVPPMVSLKHSLITCKDSIASIEIESNGNYQYSFEKNIPQKISNLVYTTNQAGVNVLKSVGQNGCITLTPFIVKEDKQKPVFTIVTDTIECDNKPVFVTFTGQGNQYFSNDGLIVDSAKQGLWVESPGQYGITATLLNTGCQETSTFIIPKVNNGPQNLKTERFYHCEDYIHTVLLLPIKNGHHPHQYLLDDKLINNVNLPINVTTGLHKLTVIDAKGCQYDSTIVVEARPVRDIFLIDEINLNYGENAQLDVVTNMPDSFIQSIQWLPSNGLSCDDCFRPTCDVLDDAFYTVTITDIDGCTIEAKTRIQVKYKANVYYPNIFNPATGRFTIFGTEYSVTEIEDMAIYDRWGNNVFQRKNFPPNDPSYGWDGTFNGHALSPGVYAFYAKVLTIKGDVIDIIGDVTIVH